MSMTDCLIWLSFFLVSFFIGMASFAYKNRHIDHALYRLDSSANAPPAPCQNLIELTFSKTATLLSSQLSLDDTLYASCDMVADLLGSSASLLTLIDGDNAHLTVASSYGLTNPPPTIPRDTSLSGKVLTSGLALIENHPTNHPSLFCPPLVFSHVTALIAAPLLYEDTFLGTVEVYSVDGKTFTKRDLLLLSALARNIATAITNARQYESATQALTEEKYLSHLAQIGASSIDPHAILSDSATCIRQSLSALWCLGAIACHNGTYEWIHQPHDSHLAPCHITTLLSAHRYTAPTLLTDDSIRSLFPQQASQILLIPLMNDQEYIGFFICGLTTATFTRYSFAKLLARQVACGLQKAHLYNQVKSMALSDGLTGLANRRNFDMLLKTELRRSASLKRHLSLIMLDLDKFKSYNDTYGHLTGDKLLAQVGQIIHHNIRTIDLAARYGGEEFSIILPECKSSDAYAIADKLRITIEESHFPDSLGTFTASITASIGIATYDPAVTAQAPDSEKMIALADKALYQAKENGRNRICTNTNFS